MLKIEHFFRPSSLYRETIRAVHELLSPIYKVHSVVSGCAQRTANGASTTIGSDYDRCSFWFKRRTSRSQDGKEKPGAFPGAGGLSFNPDLSPGVPRLSGLANCGDDCGREVPVPRDEG